MTEQINKQCPYCGEYIPVNDTHCRYCGESLMEETQNEEVVDVKEDNLSDAETAEDAASTSEAVEVSESAEETVKVSTNNVKYILIVVISFIIGFCVILGGLYFINRNTDVTIAPKAKDSVQKHSILGNKTSDSVDKAKELYKDGNLDEAAQLFEDAAVANNNPVAYYYLGEIYKDGGFTKIAIANYKAALSYKKDFFEPLKRLADIYVQKNENDTALEYANKALKIKAKDVELLKTLAQIYRNLDDEDKLLQTYQKIVSIDKKDYDANSYLAKYYYYDNKYKEAIPYLQNLLNDEYNTSTAYTLAICYSNIEYYSKAIETLNLIIKNDPYEYYEATAAKSRLSDMKDYYNATHSKKTPARTKYEEDNYNDEAEDALF